MLTSDVSELRVEVHVVRDKVHELDKQQAIVATNFTTMSQNVATLTTSVATLAVTINKQAGALLALKVLWAVMGALAAGLFEFLRLYK